MPFDPPTDHLIREQQRINEEALRRMMDDDVIGDEEVVHEGMLTEEIGYIENIRFISIAPVKFIGFDQVTWDGLFEVSVGGTTSRAQLQFVTLLHFSDQRERGSEMCLERIRQEAGLSEEYQCTWDPSSIELLGGDPWAFFCPFGEMRFSHNDVSLNGPVVYTLSWHFRPTGWRDSASIEHDNINIMACSQTVDRMRTILRDLLLRLERNAIFNQPDGRREMIHMALFTMFYQLVEICMPQMNTVRIARQSPGNFQWVPDVTDFEERGREIRMNGEWCRIEWFRSVSINKSSHMNLDETIAVLELAGWKLGDINEFLEIQGYPEVTEGAGMVFLPTKQHRLCWESPGKFTQRVKGGTE